MDKGPAVPPPDFVRLDAKGKEEFASKLGIAHPGQRSLFLDLCDKWVPEIPYQGFISPRAAASNGAVGDLAALLKKLTELRMGLLVTKKDQNSGDRVPDKIVLTDEGDPRFWYYYLGEWFSAGADNPRNAFLTEALLKMKGVMVPAEILKPLVPGQISKAFIEETKNSMTVYALTQGSDTLVVTSRDLSTLLTLASQKVRLALKSTELLTAVSRLMNSNLSEISKRMESKDALFWRSLCEALSTAREDLLADRKLHLDRGFFTAVELFLMFLDNQIQELKKQRDEARDRENDMKQLEKLLKDDKDILVSQGDVETHMKLMFLEKYADQFPSFKEDFYKLYTLAAGKTGLPPLVTVEGGYVHRDNLYIHFLKNYEKLQKEVQEEFRHRMQVILKTSNRDEDLSFVNLENLDHAVLDFVLRENPFVGELVKKPRLLAEGIIHFGKVEMGAQGVDELKPILERFFRPGTMVMKRPSSLFAVNVGDYFESAFKSLSIFVQLWIRISGQYESYKEKYVGIKAPPASKLPRANMAPGSVPGAGAQKSGAIQGLAEDDEDDLPQGPGAPASRRKSAVERAAEKKAQAQASQRDRSRKTGAPAPKPQRVYSQTEQEKAWNEFKDGIRKKKD